MSAAPCGTYAAYQRHKRKGEEPCADCRQANTAYMRDYRTRADPEVNAYRLAWQRAYNRALSRLAAAHPAIMSALIAEELQRIEADS